MRARIEEKRAVLAVVGLGYVGLGVAACFAAAGFMVVGVDVDAPRVNRINAGECPIGGLEPGLPELLAEMTAKKRFVALASYGAIAEADIILVAVDTPLTGDRRPDVTNLTNAVTRVAESMKPGTLVIIESTVAPRTCDSVVMPLLEKSKKAFMLGHCPERSTAGKILENVRTMPRVCGGATADIAELLITLYRHVTTGRLDPCDLVTAEVVKTAENAHRDVNIAFANELALYCEETGAQFPHVRELIGHIGDRTVLWAGPGVGGHCVPKDPWLLASSAPAVEPRLIAAARAVNEGMPLHVAHLLEDALDEAAVTVHKATIAILGLAYRENSDDARKSPTAALVARLADWGATLRIHDPFVAEHQKDVWEVVTGADAVVLMCAHAPYLELDLAALKGAMRTPVLIDARHIVRTQAARELGFVFRGLGRGRR